MRLTDTVAQWRHPSERERSRLGCELGNAPNRIPEAYKRATPAGALARFHETARQRWGVALGGLRKQYGVGKSLRAPPPPRWNNQRLGILLAQEINGLLGPGLS
jgi:hypothetical protein